MTRDYRQLIVASLAVCLWAASARASSFTITPTFDSSITSDSHAAAIEAVINSAIAVYEADILNPMNVNITFTEMSSGLGESSYNTFIISYGQFLDGDGVHTGGLTANVSSDHGSMATALGSLPSAASGSPVGNSTNMLIHTADAVALGLSSYLNIASGVSDGTVSLNTSITNPGTGSGGGYSLLGVVEHEIDEVLGLGSTLGSGVSSSYSTYASPEDLYRYAPSGVRSFTTNTSQKAYFSIDGTHMLTQFDNAGTGDYGDWATGSTPQVQDAIGTSGAHPTLGVNELLALNAIGYELAAPAATLVNPEPGTWVLVVTGLLAIVIGRYTRGNS